MSIEFKDRQTAEKKMNEMAGKGDSFLFLIDYSMEKCLVLPPEDAEKAGIFYKFQDQTNIKTQISNCSKVFANTSLKSIPPSREVYENAFQKVMGQIRLGNTYLINLCFESRLLNCPSFSDIFIQAGAPYKLWLKDQFIVFSPERFVHIKDRKISTYPMKGTINMDLPGAAEMLLNDPKEMAEHYTIVDLLRNDLSIVSKKVRVDKFRFLDEINIGKRRLLQTSTSISGELPEDYSHSLGSIIFSMLPAGSITGAPKKKTVEILAETENFDRGFYTGIAGIYKNGILDSCVLIRFIEKRGNQFFYKSGGGITFQSNSDKEYQELKEKIYVPFT
ncbi:MAG: aminodeoxychorismate synthase component I [Saprospirales bacterium]|nr:MAG: aminodeoxychorismate synthase component I [Saprospirales bacterium]